MASRCKGHQTTNRADSPNRERRSVRVGGRTGLSLHLPLVLVLHAEILRCFDAPPRVFPNGQCLAFNSGTWPRTSSSSIM